MQPTEFSITDSGSLRISLTAHGKVDLERLLTEHPDWDDAEIFIELIDHQLVRGWYVVPPSQVRTQTQSLVLSNSVTYDEYGNIINVGDAYWYPSHQRESYTAALFKEGYVTFDKGNHLSDIP
jgi:hypothetical protein